MHFLSQHGIKIIFLLKLLVIAGIILHDSNLIYFGEHKITAGENEGSGAFEDSEYLDKDRDEENRRKGFIEELLTLPKIKPEQTQKDELAKYFAIVERKSRQVEDRIKVLKVRQEQLDKLEKSIDTKLKKLEDEMIFFQQTLQKEKKIKDDRLNSLVEFYKKMPAKKAAPVFEKMDKDLVVALFQKIPQKQTMQILSLMTPDRSIEMSEYFGRIKSAKEYELLKEINTALRKEFEQCKTDDPQGSG